MRRPIVAANWKMFKTPSEAEALVRDLTARLAESRATDGSDVVVCPPFVALDRVGALLAGGPVALGAQNVFWEREGAFTGEIAAGMLADLGVRYVVVGHSERRQYFGETDETVNRRARATLDAGMNPIVCVGERLEEREAGRVEEVVSRQLLAGIEGLDADAIARCVVAYEPVWAIGTGRTATPDQAQEVHATIRRLLAEKYGAGVAIGIRIQYGGSVKADNAAKLFAQPDVDGALVGGASLDAGAFAAIVAAAAAR